MAFNSAALVVLCVANLCSLGEGFVALKENEFLKTNPFSSGFRRRQNGPESGAFLTTQQQLNLMKMTRNSGLVSSPDELESPLPTDDLINGDADTFARLEGMNVTIPQDGTLPSADQLSFPKFLTMQDKRVIVSIRYSGEAGLKPYFLTAAKKLKASHPDVIIERRILPVIDSESQEEATFEIVVDGKVVVGKGRSRKQKVARVDMSNSKSVFVSMQELDIAIARARRKRRPTTVYEDRTKNLPL